MPSEAGAPTTKIIASDKGFEIPFFFYFIRFHSFVWHLRYLCFAWISSVGIWRDGGHANAINMSIVGSVIDTANRWELLFRWVILNLNRNTSGFSVFAIER